MTFRSKSTPAREWKQVRIPPDECKAIQSYASGVGLAFPAALRLVLRAGLGWHTPMSKALSEANPEGSKRMTK